MCTEILLRITQTLHLISYQKILRGQKQLLKKKKKNYPAEHKAVAVLPLLDLAQTEWLAAPLYMKKVTGSSAIIFNESI